MTNKEAIDILWQYDVNFEPHPAEEVMHAIDLAIEALKLVTIPDTAKDLKLLKCNDTISRQDAIDAHCELCGDRGKCSCDICPDVEVFQLLPSAQPEQQSLSDWKEDFKGYINAIAIDLSRDDYYAIMEYIDEVPYAQPDLDEWCTDCSEYDSERHCCPRYNRVIRDAVKEAKEERKKGRWILQGDKNKKLYGWHLCSECGSWIGEPANFCSVCGADMRGENDETGRCRV